MEMSRWRETSHFLGHTNFDYSYDDSKRVTIRYRIRFVLRVILI